MKIFEGERKGGNIHTFSCGESFNILRNFFKKYLSNCWKFYLSAGRSTLSHLKANNNNKKPFEKA